MSTPVLPGPTAFDLANVRVAKPVVSGGFARWSEELSFVLGSCVHHVGGGTIAQRRQIEQRAKAKARVQPKEPMKVKLEITASASASANGDD